MSAAKTPTLSGHAREERRRFLLRRAAAQRTAIGGAWSELEVASVRGEARARTAIAWTRRIAGIDLAFGAWRTLRRSTTARGAGMVARIVGTLAESQKLSRLLRVAGWAPR